MNHSRRMWPLLRFLVFNVCLPNVDVVTDLINFFTLYPDHPFWAYITLTWMFTSFSVHATFFFIKAIWIDKTKRTCRDFYKEVVIHFPGIATFHNLWMARRLYQLKWGTNDLKTEDHKEVEEILAEAGRTSHGESMYEAGPQSVTQVRLHNTNLYQIKDLTHKSSFQLVIVLSTGKWSYFQLFSFSTSLLSLSWGASRLQIQSAAEYICHSLLPLPGLI